MTLNLTKGETISLTKAAPTATRYRVGLAWNLAEGLSMDLDASALGLNGGKCGRVADFVYFGNKAKASACGGIVHSGDNLTGAGDGDDETIIVDTAKLAPDIDAVAFVLTIYQAKQKRQSFANAPGSLCTVYDDATGAKIVEFKLDDASYATATGMKVGTLSRSADGWSFTAQGIGGEKEIGDYAKEFGLAA